MRKKLVRMYEKTSRRFLAIFAPPQLNLNELCALSNSCLATAQTESSDAQSNPVLILHRPKLASSDAQNHPVLILHQPSRDTIEQHSVPVTQVVFSPAGFLTKQSAGKHNVDINPWSTTGPFGAFRRSVIPAPF